MLTVVSYRVPLLIGALFCLTFLLTGADQKRSGAVPPVLADIRVDSNLVVIPVSVTDSRHHPITGLRREAFRIYEDKSEQAVAQFASEDAPLTAGIVFDSSGSMQDKLAQSREAVARFLGVANPADEFFLVDFNSKAQLAVPFTNDSALIPQRLLFTPSKGRTALLDAVCLAMNYMKGAHNARRALLIISDGGDNDSRYTETEIRRRLRESNLWIYAIGIYHRGGIMLPEGDHGETLLETLAENSGGRHFAVDKPSELPSIAEEIGLELRNQYLIGYQPAALARNGRYHRVQVKVVDRRDLTVTSRPGYFEPE